MPNPLSTTAAWLVLVAAGLLEVVWAIAMKASAGFTRPLATAVTFAAAAGSFWLLGVSVRALPIGTAYAVWVGIGAAGVAVMGIVQFGEPLTAARMGCIGLILLGVVGLKLLGGEA